MRLIRRTGYSVVNGLTHAGPPDSSRRAERPMAGYVECVKRARAGASAGLPINVCPSMVARS